MLDPARRRASSDSWSASFGACAPGCQRACRWDWGPSLPSCYPQLAPCAHQPIISVYTTNDECADSCEPVHFDLPSRWAAGIGPRGRPLGLEARPSRWGRGFDAVQCAVAPYGFWVCLATMPRARDTLSLYLFLAFRAAY